MEDKIIHMRPCPIDFVVSPNDDLRRVFALTKRFSRSHSHIPPLLSRSTFISLLLLFSCRSFESRTRCRFLVYSFHLRLHSLVQCSREVCFADSVN